VLNTKLQIHIQHKNISIIIKNIDKTLKLISNYNFCKNKTYSINPNYKNNNFINYSTNLNFNCQFQDNKLPIFSQLLEKLQKQNIISLQNMEYIIPNDLKKEVQNKLKIKAFKYGLNKAKQLSKIFSKSCFMKSINFSANHYPLRTFKAFSTSNIPIPQNNGSIIKLETFYKFECL